MERDLSMPDRIVGELLQPGGYLALQRLGLQGSYIHHVYSCYYILSHSVTTHSRKEVTFA